VTELEVEANDVRPLILELDGEIVQDAYLAPLNPDSEIYLIPKIGDG